VIPVPAALFPSPVDRHHHAGGSIMFRPLIGLAAVALISVASVSPAEPVPDIALSDGNVLDVQGIVGSGSNTSYEVIDFQGIGGPAFAWEYKYDTPVTGYQMLEDIQSAFPSFSVSGYNDPTYGLSAFTFTYGSYSETANYNTSDDYWTYDNAQYTGPIDLGGLDDFWNYAENGVSSNMISNGSFDGWVVNDYVANTSFVPNIPETAVPEPASLAVLGSICLLALGKTRARRSR
jgi:hypothetical protein